MWVSVGQKTAWKICKYLPFVGRCFYPAGAAAAATVRAALTQHNPSRPIRPQTTRQNTAKHEAGLKDN